MLRKKYDLFFFFGLPGEIFFFLTPGLTETIFFPWPKLRKRLTSDNKSHFYTYLQVLIANKLWLQLNSVKKLEKQRTRNRRNAKCRVCLQYLQKGGRLALFVLLGGSEFFRGEWGFCESNFQLLIKYHIR